MRPEQGGWRAYDPDGSAHACGRPEKSASGGSHMSPEMEGRVRQIAREEVQKAIDKIFGE